MRQQPEPEHVQVRSEEMKWLQENKAWLEQEHAGQWLAIEGSEVLAIGENLSEVLNEARAKGIANPLVHAVQARKYQGVQMFR